MALFVISDLYPITVQQPTHFNVAIDLGVAEDVAAQDVAGEKRLHYDVSALAGGQHQIDVKAVVIDAVQGRMESAVASLSFTKLVAPAPATGLALSAT